MLSLIQIQCTNIIQMLHKSTQTQEPEDFSSIVDRSCTPSIHLVIIIDITMEVPREHKSKALYLHCRNLYYI